MHETLAQTVTVLAVSTASHPGAAAAGGLSFGGVMFILSIVFGWKGHNFLMWIFAVLFGVGVGAGSMITGTLTGITDAVFKIINTFTT